MRVVIIGLLLVAVAVGFQDVQIGYHEAVGIPEATRIKAVEDEIIARQHSNDRIEGGAVAHPYLAGLVISLVGIPRNSVCSSSLLTRTKLVTAAHCWFDGRIRARQFVVVMGSQFLFSGGTRIPTSNVIIHPEWSPDIIANDVSIITINKISFPNTFRCIALPKFTELSNTFSDQWSIAAGYGRTSNSQAGVTVNTTVSHVKLRVITVPACQAVYGTRFVQASTLCTNGTGGVGICGADSGGPLVLNRNGVSTLIGISSFFASNGCQLGFPSVFARVTSFHNFIQQHLSN